jgi:hypothetical protein
MTRTPISRFDCVIGVKTFKVCELTLIRPNPDEAAALPSRNQISFLSIDFLAQCTRIS